MTKRRRHNRPRILNSDRSRSPKKVNTPEKVGFLSRGKILTLLGIGIAITLGHYFPDSSKKKNGATTEQIEQNYHLNIEPADNQPQPNVGQPVEKLKFGKLIINPENIPPDDYRLIYSLINEHKITKLIEEILGDSLDKRPYELVWTENGYSEKHKQAMQPNADAQVFKDEQLILLNGQIFRMYRDTLPENKYCAHFGTRLIHELVHTYLPCMFENDHFEEGLAVYLGRELGKKIGLEEAITELNKPLDFKYSNKEIFAKECNFVTPFEWLGGISYYNGNIMWKKLTSEDPDIIKKLLKEINNSGLKGSLVSKKQSIELILKVNPKLKELIDSFKFLSDFQLRNPELVAMPLNFDKSRNGLMIVILKRDEADCDQVVPTDYYQVSIMVD
ncbi:hypothetical protein KAR91_66080, partial [Candidatus Pacearchaeota archaeon]|nr:hypothetical protein [Candidatus Pacearchaeota archaeon]